MVKCPNCNGKNISREAQINHVESWFCYDCQSYFDTKVSREVIRIDNKNVLNKEGE